MTEGQRACLRLVLRHMSSKEIGRALNISSHTVDQRLKQAMRTLGASSRVEAARALAAEEGHQELVYQSADIEPPPPQPSHPAPANAAQRPADPPDPASSTKEVGDRDALQRIGWVVAIIAGAAIVFAALFVGLNALSEFTR